MPRRPDRPPVAAGARAACLALLALGVVAVAGCSLERLTPRTYEPPLQQGNVIEPDAVAKLKPGMTRSQVRFLLGTPMVVDVFRNDRWDYVYLHRRQGEPVRQRRLAVFFEGDLLVRVETDRAEPAKPAPAAAGAGTAGSAPKPAAPGVAPVAGAAPATAAAAPATAPSGPATAPAPEPSRGFFGRLLERIGL